MLPLDSILHGKVRLVANDVVDVEDSARREDLEKWILLKGEAALSSICDPRCKVIRSSFS